MIKELSLWADAIGLKKIPKNFLEPPFQFNFPITKPPTHVTSSAPPHFPIAFIYLTYVYSLLYIAAFFLACRTLNFVFFSLIFSHSGSA